MPKTTSSRTRRVIGAGVVLLAGVLPATIALARPPIGDDPPTPPEPTEPTTVVEDPPATPSPTTPPAPTIPRQVQSFTVTADSVVATASLAYAGTPSTLIVYWGDNTATELTPPPPGSVVVRHEYAPQPGGKPFDKIVTANVAGESAARLLRITPRYLVTQDEASFTSIDNCDPSYEEHSEWQIRRNPVYVGGRLVADAKSWNQTKPTNVFPNYEPLPDSAVQAEMTGDEWMSINYQVVEVDPLDDDVASPRSFTIQPDGFVGTEWNHLTFDDDRDCESRISAYISLSVVRPGL